MFSDEAADGGIGTVSAPRYYPGREESHSDMKRNTRLFTYDTAEGIVSGTATNIMFKIDRPASQIWPVFKDFNLWQIEHHYYSEILGDVYGEEDGGLSAVDFRLSPASDQPPYPNLYQIIRVLPEYAIVVHQPVPQDGQNGGVSRGFHIFMLNEFAGETTVTILMEHATRSPEDTVDEALNKWRALLDGWDDKWRASFIPALKKRVYAND